MNELWSSRWWQYGNYTGDDCQKCGRQRMLSCTDDFQKERVVCEKCHWEPAANEYLDTDA